MGTNFQVVENSYVDYLKTFVRAVMAYTGSKKVNIIAHNMGVTLARKVV